jgi:hypothetical protein
VAERWTGDDWGKVNRISLEEFADPPASLLQIANRV